MNVTLYSQQIRERMCVNGISSKSYVHRLLFCGALCDNISEENPLLIRTNIFSEDMLATMKCLNALGACVDKTEGGFTIVRGLMDAETKNSELRAYCSESGSTARFLLPLAASLCKGKKTCHVDGGGRLTERTNEALVTVLSEHGAVMSGNFLPIHISGSLRPGTYEIPGNISSQYITGLLITLPTLDGDSDIVITTSIESAGYLDITLEVLAAFGIRIDKTTDGYHVPGNQRYHAPDRIITEADWSNGAFVLALGAVKGQVTVKGLNPESVQGDRAFVDILRRFGGIVEFSGTDVTVIANKMKAVSLDVSQVPDLVPALACLALSAEGESCLQHVDRLRLKESDRVEAIINLIRAFGGNARTEKDALTGFENLFIGKNINEQVMQEHITVDSCNDHRMVMAAVILQRAFNLNELTIKGAQAINKSYPGYFEELELITCRLNWETK